jgi:hypothetical protein
MNRCCGRPGKSFTGTAHELLYIHQNQHALAYGA